MNNTQKNTFHQGYCFWFITAALLVSTVLLFWGGPDYESSRSFKQFWNTGHIVYFALLSYLLTKWHLIARQLVIKRWVIILSITLVLGILIEVLQYGTQRNPDLWDVARDLTGSFLVLAFNPGYTGNKTKAWKWLIKATAVIALIAQFIPLTVSLIDEAIARQQFPVLSKLETPFEIDRWSGDAGMAINSDTSISSGNTLEVSLSTKQYSGVELKYFPQDWRNHQSLKIKIFQPQEAKLRITCRIHDLQHTLGEQEFEDRFNKSFLLAQGWNEIEIDLDEVAAAPENRKMDLSQIRGLGIFSISLPQPRTIYLDEVYLSK